MKGSTGIVVEGSVLQAGRFTSGSDVEGADVDTESRFWRALEEDCGGAVDLRMLQGAVARAVADHGERVYVRELPFLSAPFSRIWIASRASTPRLGNRTYPKMRRRTR